MRERRPEFRKDDMKWFLFCLIIFVLLLFLVWILKTPKHKENSISNSVEGSSQGDI